MDSNLKYSLNEIENFTPYNIYKKPYKKSLNNYNNLKDYNSINSILDYLSKNSNNFYESSMKIFQEINNNNLTFSNQILFIQYLLSVIKNKNAVNINMININNELEKISSHLEKIIYNRKILDNNFLEMSNKIINYNNNFQNILKKLKKLNLKNEYESPKKSRNI